MPRGERSPTVTSATVYGAVLLVFLLIGLALAFSHVVTLLLLVLLAAIVAVPLSAAADALARWHLPRAIAVPLTLALALVVLGAIIALIVPTFIAEGRHLIDQIPRIVTTLNHTFSSGSSKTNIGRSLHDTLSGYTTHPQRLLGPVTAIAAGVGGIATATVAVIFTAIFSAIYPDSLRSGIVRLTPPRSRQVAETILHRFAVAYIGWLLGLAISMAILGTVTFVGLALIGIPFALVFAVLTAMLAVIPYYGALASYIPPFAVALTISLPKALLVLLVSLIAHLIEGNLVSPLVMARAVRLHPALVAVGVLAVERLAGFFGLLLAVPVLVTVKILVEELWINRIEAHAHAELTVVQSAGGSAQTDADAGETRDLTGSSD